MIVETNEQFRLSTLESVKESDIKDFENLLEILTGTPQDTDQVQIQLERAVGSTNTTVFEVRDTVTDRIVSTATVNRLPVLAPGSVMWIDDVVTDNRYQGKGLSKRTMNAMESEAAEHATEVKLTSSPDRGPARTGYHKRGYELFPDGLGVYRNVNLQVHDDALRPLSDYTESELVSMAELLDETPESLEFNLRSVLDSTFSAVFIRKQNGSVTGVGVANLCPIPVGYKPWIDNVAGNSAEDTAAVSASAESWFADKHAPYANVVATNGDNLSSEYERRRSGLFIKRFISVE